MIIKQLVDNLQNTLELPSIKMVPQIKEIKRNDEVRF